MYQTPGRSYKCDRPGSGNLVPMSMCKIKYLFNRFQSFTSIIIFKI